MNTTVSTLPVKSTPALARAWEAAGFGDDLIPLKVGGNEAFQKGWQSLPRAPGLHSHMQAGHNLGLRTARYPACDVEGTPHALLIKMAIMEWIDKRGWHKPQCWRSRKRTLSTACLFRLDDPLGRPWRKRALIDDNGTRLFELLGEGQQLMIEGVRQDKGGTVLDWTARPAYPGDLPSVDVDDLNDLMEHVTAALVAGGCVLRDTSASVSTTGKTGDDLTKAPAEQIKRWLDLIPNADVDYDEWQAVVCAAKGAAQQGEFDAVHDLAWAWSAQSAKHDDARFDKTWASRVDQADAVSLMRRAQDANPGAMAAMDFDDVEDDEDKVQSNPLTGAPRYMAKRVMVRALQEDNSAKNSYAMRALSARSDFDAMASVLTKPEPIIPDVVYPQIVHTVVAAPGVGKSLLQAMWAHCATTGLDDRDRTKQATPAHVFALFGEDSTSIVFERMSACQDNYGQGQTDAVFEPVCASPLELVSLDEGKKKIERRITRGLHQVCDVVEALIHMPDDKPLALMLDMLRSTFFGDDNVRWQIDALYRVLRAIMEEAKLEGLDVGVVVTHHATKAASRANTGGFMAAGSIGIEGNSRLVTELRSLHGGVIEATVSKSNYGETGAKRYWAKRPVSSRLGGQTVWPEPVDTSTAGTLSDGFKTPAEALKAGASGQGQVDQLRIDGVLEDLHRWALDLSNKPLAMRKTKNCWQVEDWIDAHGLVMSKAEIGTLKDRMLSDGAFVQARIRRGAQGSMVDTESGLEAVTDWGV